MLPLQHVLRRHKYKTLMRFRSQRVKDMTVCASTRMTRYSTWRTVDYLSDQACTCMGVILELHGGSHIVSVISAVYFFCFFFVGCLSCCCCGISNPNTGTKFVPAMPRNSRSILVAGSQAVKVTHMEPVTVARQTAYAMARNFNFACQ